MDLSGKRVVVTGGAGFLGSHVVERLQQKQVAEIVVPRSSDYDLVNQAAAEQLYADARPDLVIHLAAQVGGIGANQKNPGKYFYDNLQMGVHVLEASRKFETAKTVVAGTICAYPKFAPIPFKEEEIWNGYPEETNAPYGIAKKALLVMSDAYRRQYGLNSVVVFPVNLYGPRDNFDLESSHVIPAMIRKCLDAKARNDAEITLWGDGTPTREFLYVDDCARALILASERYDSSDPVNIGAGFEISMGDLATKIVTLTGYPGRLVWDTERPNGQPRRMLDTTRAKERFGFEAKCNLDDGLRQTIDWYSSHSDTL